MCMYVYVCLYICVSVLFLLLFPLIYPRREPEETGYGDGYGREVRSITKKSLFFPETEKRRSRNSKILDNHCASLTKHHCGPMPIQVVKVKSGVRTIHLLGSGDLCLSLHSDLSRGQQGAVRKDILPLHAREVAMCSWRSLKVRKSNSGHRKDQDIDGGSSVCHRGQLHRSKLTSKSINTFSIKQSMLVSPNWHNSSVRCELQMASSFWRTWGRVKTRLFSGQNPKKYQPDQAMVRCDGNSALALESPPWTPSLSSSGISSLNP